MNIGFVGMTHLGIVSSITAAEKKNYVICYDKNPNKIKQLKKCNFGIKEPNLDLLYKKNLKRIEFTNNISELNKTDLVYISTDIKTNSNGKSNYTEINLLLEKIIQHLNKNIILVILCQIPPGFTRNINWPKDKLYYQVETLIFGKAFLRALNPERIIIGKYEKNRLSYKLNLFLKKFNCPILDMNYESAELCKISINLYLISQVTTTNSINEISKKIGANWDDIKIALELDSRIGKQAYLNPGLGISGGNLERDLNSVKLLGNKNKSAISLFETFETLSKYYKNWCLRQFNNIIKKQNYVNLNVGILGLTYKKNTNSIKNSPSISLINKIKKYSKNIFVHDPILNEEEKGKYGLVIKSSKELIKRSNIIFVMLDTDEYRKLNLDKVVTRKKKIIIDPFSVFKFIKNNSIQIHTIK